MSPLDRTGLNYADDLFNKRMEQLARETSQKIAAVYADHTKRNTIRSGMHMTDHAKAIADRIRLAVEARAESLMKAYEKSGIPLDSVAISAISNEVETYCRAQQPNAARAMSQVIRQTFQGNAPPNLEQAVIQGMDTHINRACVEVARDLRIKRHEVELAASRANREMQSTIPANAQKRWDVFICHASADKDDFVRPLAAELGKTLEVWFDEMTLTVGDSLRQKIDEGLANSRYGIVVLSKKFFERNWPQAELDGLVSREMAGTHTKVILPVWHKITHEEVAARSPLLAGRIAAESKEGIPAVVAKLHEAMNTGVKPVPEEPAWHEVDGEPTEYYDQRRRLPENEVFNAIVAGPRWRISIFPAQFKTARFRDLDQCKSFAVSSCIRMQSGINYPQIWPDTLETGRDYIACDTKSRDWPEMIPERWVLFRSGLFVQNRAFNEKRHPNGRIHALEILDVTTAALEFATLMAQHVVLDPEVAITVGLHAVEGKQLTWPQDITLDNDRVSRNSWCQDANIDASVQLNTGQILSVRREAAFHIASQIYSKFGWSDPPNDILRSEQQNRFS
jgi:hypothetical protein